MRHDGDKLGTRGPDRAAGYVLVVDDDDDLRVSLTEFLEQKGYRVVAASGGLQALAAMKPENTRPCVVLLDWNMPGLNGRQVIEWMLANLHVADVPTYVVTGTPHLVPRSVSVIKKGDIDSIVDAVHTHCLPDDA